ncbi:MAG: hypothetical protein ACPGVG_06870 [Mycobacterium sp.]
MSADTRLKLGIGLLVLGLFMPLGTVFVAATNWPDTLKTLIGGILFFGLEIMAIPAVALMGQENYNRIVNRVKATLKRLKPPGDVGRTRYRIGLALFGVPLLIGWIGSYLAAWRPEDYPIRIGINLALDLTLVSSLFVLGGDFWDKLRALFRHDARAMVVHSPAETDGRSASSGGDTAIDNRLQRKAHP